MVSSKAVCVDIVTRTFIHGKPVIRNGRVEKDGGGMKNKQASGMWHLRMRHGTQPRLSGVYTVICPNELE